MTLVLTTQNLQIQQPFQDKEKGFAEPRVAGQAIIADPALFMYKYLNENTNYGRKHIFCNNCINLFFARKLLRIFAADLKNNR